MIHSYNSLLTVTTTADRDFAVDDNEDVDDDNEDVEDVEDVEDEEDDDDEDVDGDVLAPDI